ncbi:hypothetical protein L2E08_25595, partial [Salmonella enterica subsp. enterica serovar Weltevreden]
LGLRAFTEANDVAPGDRLAVRLTVTRGPDATPGAVPAPTAWALLSPAPAVEDEERQRGLRVLLLDRGIDSQAPERSPWLLT